MRLSDRSIRPLACAGALLLVAAVPFAQEPEPLSLPDAMAYALDHNPRLRAAAAHVAQAGVGTALAHAAAEPAFSLGASARVQNPVEAIEIPVPPGRTIEINRAFQASAAVAVAWPLWTGGRVGAAVDAARAQVDAAEADLQQATEQLLYEVGVAYYDVLRARSGRASAQAVLTTANADLRTAEASRAVGALTGAGLSAAQAAQQQAQQALAAAESAVADAEEAFNQVLGRELDVPVRLVDEPLTLGEPQEPEATQIALAARPELLALAHRSRAAQAVIAQAHAERNPTVSFVGRAALQTPTDVTEAHAEFAGLEFSWPILNHPAPRAQERLARATAEELQATERELTHAIALQVAESSRRVGDAREAVAAAREALRAADAAAREARALYDVGAATGAQRTAAQSALTQARTRAAQADDGLSIALLTRARSLGLLRALFLAPSEEAVAP